MGDTIRTLTGPSGPGLQRVYWPFNGRPPARAALSPAQKRDSAMMIARIDRTVDSLVAAGGSRPGLDSAKTQLMAVVSGGAGGFGGGVAVAVAEVVERPASRPSRPGPVRAESSARVAAAAAAAGVWAAIPWSRRWAASRRSRP